MNKILFSMLIGFGVLSSSLFAVTDDLVRSVEKNVVMSNSSDLGKTDQSVEVKLNF